MRPHPDTGLIEYRKMVKGITKTIPTGTRDIAEANRRHADIELSVLNELKNPQADGPVQLSYNELAKKFINDENAEKFEWTPGTYKAYKQKITGYINKGLTGNMNNRGTIRNHVNIMVRWGVRKKYDVEHLLLEGNTSSGQRDRVATEQEMDLLWEVSGKLGDLIKFIYYTGIRIGEAVTIEKKNYRDGIIDVWGKSGHRLVRVNDNALKYLRDYNIWIGRNGKHIFESQKEHWLDGEFRKLRKKIGVGDLHFHDLRKTFGTHYITMGGRLEELQILLGHSNYKTTENHYLFLKIYDLTNDNLIKWVKRFNP